MIRRSPDATMMPAIVVELNVVYTMPYGVGAKILLEILEDGSRPNEQVWVGAMLLNLWVEWAM